MLQILISIKTRSEIKNGLALDQNILYSLINVLNTRMWIMTIAKYQKENVTLALSKFQKP